VWAAYLGLILILHGIVICFDSALAGTPTIEQKRFGNRLAYVGGAVAGVAVVFAYAIDLRQRAVKMEAVKPNPLDDLAA